MCQTKLAQDGVEEPQLDSPEKGSIYDQSLPKNDLKILAPVRQWEKRMGFLTPLRWDFIILSLILHLTPWVWSAISLYYGRFPKWQSFVFAFIMGQCALFGVTAGAHRYWTHKAFKATLPLRLIFFMCFSASGQKTLLEWIEEHRVHHKCVDTDADPHNTHRGFFFSHVGCQLLTNHPRYYEELAKIDLTDIKNDPLVMFQTRHVVICNWLFCFVIPAIANVYLFNESWEWAILCQGFFKFLLTTHITFCVNSVAHTYGSRPYDASILPVENALVSAFMLGEGWHNYHHTFPWDYKASELPYKFNLSTLLLDFFAKIGWAYDLKTASPELIRKTALRKGEKKLNGL